jgi:hypothetical protein
VCAMQSAHFVSTLPFLFPSGTPILSLPFSPFPSLPSLPVPFPSLPFLFPSLPGLRFKPSRFPSLVP